MADKSGFKTSITFSSSNLTLHLLSLGGPGATREAIDISTMDTTTGYREFIPADLKDGGEVSIDFAFASSVSPATALASTGEVIAIKWGTSTGDYWSFKGFMLSYEPGAQMDDRMTGSATIKVAGPLNFDSSSG